MTTLEPLFTPEEIDAAVARLAREVRRDYADKSPVLVGVLKGCFVFMADLVRALDMPLEVEFMALSSYGRGRARSSGHVRVVHGLRASVRRRHILVVEDIVDSGATLDFTLGYLRRRGATSVRVCALFERAVARREAAPVDYLGLTVPDCFVVGYGLDYDERFRHLRGLYCLREGG